MKLIKFAIMAVVIVALGAAASPHAEEVFDRHNIFADFAIGLVLCAGVAFLVFFLGSTQDDDGEWRAIRKIVIALGKLLLALAAAALAFTAAKNYNGVLGYEGWIALLVFAVVYVVVLRIYAQIDWRRGKWAR